MLMNFPWENNDHEYIYGLAHGMYTPPKIEQVAMSKNVLRTALMYL